MNRINSQLAARAGTRQLDALHYANAAANSVDAVVAGYWRKIVALLTREGKRRQSGKQLAVSRNVAYEVADIIHAMHVATHQTLHRDFTRLAKWGHKSAADVLVKTLPVGYLRRAVDDKGMVGPLRRGLHSGLAQLPDRLLARKAVEQRDLPLGNDLPIGDCRFTEDFPRDRPGLVHLGIDHNRLTTRDALGRLREPTRRLLSDEEQRELAAKLLFPPPSVEEVARILAHPIAGSTWLQDMHQATRLANPHVVAGIVAGGFAAGHDPRGIAKLLLPAVQGVKSTARRVARTYGMQIAHASQMQAHAQVADLIVGYQVHALLDQHTRSWHAARSGTIYYSEPKTGQKGPDQMPHPPLEAQDPRERPPGTPHLAPY